MPLPDWLAALAGAPRALVLVPLVFCHRFYARAYLGSPLWAPFALAHYLVLGERRGHLPNPFFDPAFFSAASGTRSFVLHFAIGRFWFLPTSSRFEPASYVKKARLPAGFHPLADFWRRGFDKRIDPAPGFDLAFFRDAVCRDVWDDRRHAFALFAQSDWQVPTNPGTLRRAQDAFVAALAFRIVRTEPARHRHLVFVQAGRTFAAPYATAPGDYDLLLNFYEEPTSEAMAPTATVCVQTGTKATAIRLLLDRAPDLLLAYESVLFLDDDVTIDAATIEALFATAARDGLDLAQASLTPESGCFFACLKQPYAGPAVRPLNAVEIMMPLVSRRVLERFGWVFGEAVSGWAVDMLLGAKVREAYGDGRIALIGHAVARHERPVDTADGRFYRFLRSRGIDAATEAGDLISRFALDPDIEWLEP